MTATVTALPARAIWADADPFAIFADELAGWNLAFTELDGVMGFTDVPQRTIWVDVRLDARERRSTVFHEILHALRGDETDDEDAERVVRLETARRLVPERQLRALLRDVLRGAHQLQDVAEVLDVDMGVLRTRIRDLYAPHDAAQLTA